MKTWRNVYSSLMLFIQIIRQFLWKVPYFIQKEEDNWEIRDSLNGAITKVKLQMFKR